jgi:LacI family transcriptional regulator
MPVVVLDRRVPGAQVDIVRCDSEEGGYRLTRLLLDLGHRHIAMLTGPLQVSTARDRTDGYLRAMREAGVQPDDSLIISGPYTIPGGSTMMRQALDASPRPTAIFAANNFIATGAYRALREAGLKVPEDMALVSFDDLPEPMVLEPILTVAAQPAYEMGQRVTELLFARLSDPSAPPQEIVLPTEIIIRRSSGGKVPGG